MGKIDDVLYQRSNCADQSAPICDDDRCRASHHANDDVAADAETKRRGRASRRRTPATNDDDDDPSSSVRELLVVGAGPHALFLVLRLLEADADLLSDGERHRVADASKRARPVGDVHDHAARVAAGRPPRRRRRRRRRRFPDDPPPLSLDEVLSSVSVVDASSNEWMADWNRNFESIGIPTLRSLINAHGDPYDHRTLEYYAENRGRRDELVTVPDLTRRDEDFRGPYQAPTTALFRDFHERLAEAYGVDGVVRRGRVEEIVPTEGDERGPLFRVLVRTTTTDDDADADDDAESTTTVLWARRVVCATGPAFEPTEAFWEASLRRADGAGRPPPGRVLGPSEIVPWLRERRRRARRGRDGNDDSAASVVRMDRLLVVGGGVTAAQLALLAARSAKDEAELGFSCRSVVLARRSRGAVVRHFDVDVGWIGPRRGRRLADLRAVDPVDRAALLRRARGGGSVPPATARALEAVDARDGTSVVAAAWDDDAGVLRISLDDGGVVVCDAVWSATGNAEDRLVEASPLLAGLRRALPVDVDAEGSLPVTDDRLSWRAPTTGNDEPAWKQTARRRLFVMGGPAALELGPDASNLLGARQGAVRVARALREDFANERRRRETTRDEKEDARETKVRAR